MPVKVLVADDSATMRKVIEMTFAGEDVELLTVDSGDAAISGIARFGPDVVIVDLTMPVDGYAVAEQLKSAGLNVPVIVMASQHTAYDAAKGAASGVDDHVIKPFESQAFLDKVMAASKNKGAAKAAPAIAAAPPLPPRASAVHAPPPLAAKPAAPPAIPARPATPAFSAPPRVSVPGTVSPAVAAPAQRAAAPAASTAATGAMEEKMQGKLAGLGLSPDQVSGVMALSREVIEQVVWEVVPELAETIIREEIRRLTA